MIVSSMLGLVWKIGIGRNFVLGPLNDKGPCLPDELIGEGRDFQHVGQAVNQPGGKFE